MTWTYDNNPGTDDADMRRDAVRLLVGDTDPTDEQISDEEIAFALSQSGNNIYGAAAIAARNIAAKYGRMVDTRVESVSSSYSQRQKSYLDLATRMEREYKIKGASFGAPVAGGVSISDMDSVESDSDRVEPKFRVDQFSNPPDDDGDDWWKH